jgi:hypothetical protein
VVERILALATRDEVDVAEAPLAVVAPAMPHRAAS